MMIDRRVDSDTRIQVKLSCLQTIFDESFPMRHITSQRELLFPCICLSLRALFRPNRPENCPTSEFVFLRATDKH